MPNFAKIIINKIVHIPINEKISADNLRICEKHSDQNNFLKIISLNPLKRISNSI